MMVTNTSAIRALVDGGRLEASVAVDILLDAGEHGGVRDRDVACPECGVMFRRAHPGRWNTCSDPCQIAWNTAIMDLDGGRSIIKVSDLTPERTVELLAAVGLEVIGPVPVVLS